MPTIKTSVEVDVTYVNKTWFSLRPNKGGNVKHYVIGFFQREPGKAIIKALPDNKPETITQAVFESVAKGAILYSQENILPSSLNEFYEMRVFEEGKHINGDIHVNNVNNMWRDLKRQLKRVHVQVSQKHLQGYCNEVAWRINNRHLTPMEKFNLLLSNCEVRCSYKNLIK